jgi:multisubunit Na+/H+ antiporter MnhG subunit
MLGIVWVEALVDEVAPAEWPVVCVHGWLTAWVTVSVLGVGAHAAWIAGEDGRPEPGLVPLAVASLPCAAASLLCLALVVVAPSAAQAVGRAAGYGAHPVSPMSGHVRLRVRSLCALGVVGMKQKLDVPLGIVVVGVVLMIGCRLIVWWPGVILGAALILGVLVPVAARRRGRGLRDAEVPSQTNDQL